MNKKEEARLLREHGDKAHSFWGDGFSRDAIKPVEGIFVMAKEYQKWRIKATAFVRWTQSLIE